SSVTLSGNELDHSSRPTSVDSVISTGSSSNNPDFYEIITTNTRMSTTRRPTSQYNIFVQQQPHPLGNPAAVEDVYSNHFPLYHLVSSTTTTTTTPTPSIPDHFRITSTAVVMAGEPVAATSSS